MKKNIPYIFEDATFYRELEPIKKLSNVGRGRIRAFYCGKNRNGSFINSQVAEQLICSASRGNVPIIGFYNYETEDFERHMGPQIAKGYGYIPENCNFAWEDYIDKYGVKKTYACFDCILFCDYFEEAKEIIGKPQSMELNQDTIVGDWADIDGEEFFVYSSAEMKGFCVLGSNVEPCFEAATFFEKGESKFDKFSLLLSDLMEKVKEAEKEDEGGEQEMNEEVSTVETSSEEEVVVSDEEQTTNENSQVKDEETIVTEESVEETSVDLESIQQELDEMTNNFNSAVEENTTLQNTITELQNDLANMTEEIKNYKNTINSLNDILNSEKNKNSEYENKISVLETKITEYENKNSVLETKITEYELIKKNNLIDDYEKVLPREEISDVRSNVADFSYDELESKLAVSFSRKNLRGQRNNRVPVLGPEQNEFEKLMAKYRK